MAHVYAARAVLPTMIKRKQGYFVQIIHGCCLVKLVIRLPQQNMRLSY